jgi:CMP-N,N'-diacetyllegionaminic acid synthase
MIDGRKVLGLVIARGGSKGVPRKNVADVCGKPLIAWTIEAAKSSAYIDRTVLSSEDEEIIAAAKACGCDVPFVRRASLATDEATGTAVVLDAIDRIPGYDYVVLLQATSPLRLAEDIDGAVERCIARDAPACVTVSPLGKPLEWLVHIDAGDRLAPVMERQLPDRRQDASTVYAPNGAVFVAACDWLRESGTLYSDETVAYAMPAERSVDIDSPVDLSIARALLAQRTG